MDNYDTLERELIKSINKLSRNKIPKPTKRSKGITSLLKVGKELEEEFKLNNPQKNNLNNSFEPNKKVEKEKEELTAYENWIKIMEETLKELHKPIRLILPSGEEFSLADYK